MITVIGLGFVGLSTVFNFCYLENKKVYGYDLDKVKINDLKCKKMYLYESEFSNMLDSSLNKTFFPVNNLDCIKESDYIFICVNTNQKKDGNVDLSCIFNSIDQVLSNYDKSKYRVIIIKSSVPPTTTKLQIIPYIESKGLIVGKDIGVANNPEFLREGYCYYDIKNVDRIVIGTNDIKTKNKMNDLYKKNKDIIFNASLNTCEFVNYLSNSMLATMISFSNEMASIALAIDDVDIASSFKILHKDKRWNDCNMKSYIYIQDVDMEVIAYLKIPMLYMM